MRGEIEEYRKAKEGEYHNRVRISKERLEDAKRGYLTKKAR